MTVYNRCEKCNDLFESGDLDLILHEGYVCNDCIKIMVEENNENE